MKTLAVAIFLLAAVVPTIAFPITIWHKRIGEASHGKSAPTVPGPHILAGEGGVGRQVRLIVPGPRDPRFAGAEEENVSFARAMDFSSVSPRTAEESGSADELGADTPSGVRYHPLGLTPVYPTAHHGNLSGLGSSERIITNTKRGPDASKARRRAIGPRRAHKVAAQANRHQNHTARVAGLLSR
jgi:hypothetical protein